jgi:hydroxymethylpyrimidine kinase/phosphomethylpyrimidine kinase
VSAANNYDQPTVLTIAGFDPSGGAGIIADIRTFAHFGCRPTAAITSLTFQNSQSVFGAIHESAESLRAQILPIVNECRVEAVKVGMLPTAELVREVAGLIRARQLPAPIVDPVMQSSSGHRLMEEEAFEVFVTELLPLSRLVTPNIPEAEKLAGMNIEDADDVRQAAARIRELGARAVLIKGGHLKLGSGVRRQGSEKPEAIDVLDDEGQVEIFCGEWIDGAVRGTGCMLSSAIAACLGKRMSLTESVSAAKIFVAAEILNSTLKTENSKLT